MKTSPVIVAIEAQTDGFTVFAFNLAWGPIAWVV